MGIKLVIVDDAPFIVEGIRGLLGGTDIQCVGEAFDGEEAITVVQALRPDVILMDLVMPKKNGIEAVKEILQTFPDAKIIACSTEEQTGLLLKAIEAGCCGFIAKPFTADKLIKTIKKAAKKAS